jgi:hypothetical protein
MQGSTLTVTIDIFISAKNRASGTTIRQRLLDQDYNPTNSSRFVTFSFSARFLSVAFILAVSSQATLQAQTFTLHPNGKTVLCPTAGVGTTGSVGGVTYTKRTRDQINASNAATTCTSGIENMRGLFEEQYDIIYSISIRSKYVWRNYDW